MNRDISPVETRKLVDEYLRHVLEKRTASAQAVGATYAELWRRVTDIALAGGKRIRPYLTMIGHGSLDERILPVAVAQELVHIAILMHDDVIDQDFVRHGQKNVSGVYTDVYGPYLHDQTRTVHYAHSAAILAGDTLLSEAYFLIAQADYDDVTKQKVTQQLQRSLFEVIGGELMDVEAGFMNSETFDPLQVYRYKTSSYSFIGPLVSGAYCAQLEQSAVEQLEIYATNVGIAFQIQDDLLGVFGDEADTGKSTMTDIREGKQTLLIASHQKAMDENQRARYDVVFGVPDAPDEAVNALKADMVATGAKDATRAQANDYFTRAIDALQQLPEGVQRAELMKFTDTLRGRKT